MASLITVSGLTINPEEAQEIGALVIEKSFVQGAMSECHSMETGIYHKMQIPFMGQMADSLKKVSGCTPNTGTGISLTEKFWEPETFDSRWEHCATDLNKLLKLFAKAQKVNPDVFDRTSSQELGVIFALIDQMIQTVLPTKVWFSDKVGALIAGGGKFKAGTDIALYNVIDGLWKQIFTEVASGDANYSAITENAGASYAAQVLPVDGALAYLTKAVEIADSRLLQDAGAQILVTRSIADNYRNTLRTKTLGAGFLEVVEGGKTQLLFDGYKVVVKHEWDRDIKALFDTGAKLDKPHRILFTTPENIPVATLSESDLTNLESFYDQYRKTNVIDVAFSLDTKHLEDYMTVALY